MARSKSAVDRVMGAIVPKAVGAIDADELIASIDLNATLERIDLDAVLARIDMDALLDRIDVDALVARIDLALLLDRIDIDALVARVDVNGLVAGVDIDALVARVDVGGLIETVDIDGLVRRVDLNSLLTEVDIEALLARIDINVMMERVDIGALLDRVDLDVLMAKIDVQAIIERVDLNALLAEMDIAALMARAGIDKIVSDASTGLATRVLDTARGQVLGIDVVILALVDRVLRRKPLGGPSESPVESTSEPLEVGPGVVVEQRIDHSPSTNRPAGPLSRLFAFMIDSFVVSGVFSVGVNLGSSLIGLFTGRELDLTNNGGPGWLVAFGTWWFLYLWLTVAISGRTLGKGLLGIRVVAVDREPLGPGSAALRAMAFPFSFVLGLGFVPMILGRQRRAAHDYVARSREIVDWGPRSVVLPSALERWVRERRVS